MADARAAIEDLHKPDAYLGAPVKTVLSFGLTDDEAFVVISEWRSAHGKATDKDRFSTIITRARQENASKQAESPVTDAEYIATTASDPPKAHYPSGFTTLDRKLGGGLKSGQSTVLIGATGSGKTAAAQNVAINVARAGTPVVLIGSELTRKMNVQRAAAIASNRPIRELEFGDPAESAAKVAMALKGLPIYTWSTADIDDVADPAGFVEAKAKAVEALTGTKPLVIMDYLQDYARVSDESVRMTVGSLSKKLRLVAVRNNWASLVVSSTSRANHLKSDGKPISLEPEDYKTFAKESGDIEYDAGQVLVLITMPREEGTLTRDAFIMSAKDRGGESGPVGFTFDGSTGIFREEPSALDRIVARSESTQSRAQSGKEDKIRAAVLGGAASRPAIYMMVRGNKQVIYKTINSMIAAGVLREIDRKIVVGDGIPTGIFGRSQTTNEKGA
jgi:replicative DNA helicase